MYTSRWATRIAIALAPFGASAWLGACAADAGDLAKSAMPITGDESSTPPGAEAGQPGSDATSPPPPSGDAGGILDATSPGDVTVPPGMEATAPPMDGTAPADTSAPPVDTGPGDTAPPPPPDDGGGCSAGATVITATDPSAGAATAGTVGNFGTTGAVCVKVLGGIVSQYGGWNSSNVTGRTVTLNGAVVPVGGSAGAVAPGPDGYAIWEWSAGADSYASMSLY